MAESDAEWETWIAGVRAGDPAALASFYRIYGPSLERLAARAITPGLRRRFGPETIAQSVCRTFVMRVRGDGGYELADGDSLWRLLCAIALTKVRERSRHHLRQRRSPRREARDEDAEARLGASPAAGAGPDEEAAFREQFETLLEALDDEERGVLELRLEARSQVQIAEALGVSERTVRRILGRLESRFQRAFA